MNATTPSVVWMPSDRLIIEITYTADCSGDGGYVISASNHPRWYTVAFDEATPTFSQHFARISAAGWELAAVWGGSAVAMEYDYRQSIWYPSEAAKAQQWCYMEGTLLLKQNTWYLTAINTQSFVHDNVWHDAYQTFLEAGWQLVLEPYPLVNRMDMREVIFRRPAKEACTPA